MVELAVWIVSFFIVLWAGLLGAGILFLLAPYLLVIAGAVGLMVAPRDSELTLIALTVGLGGVVWTACRHRSSFRITRASGYRSVSSEAPPRIPTSASSAYGQRTLLVAGIAPSFFFIVGAIDEFGRKGPTLAAASAIGAIGVACALIYGLIYLALRRSGRLPLK